MQAFCGKNVTGKRVAAGQADRRAAHVCGSAFMLRMGTLDSAWCRMVPLGQQASRMPPDEGPRRLSGAGLSLILPGVILRHSLRAEHWSLVESSSCRWPASASSLISLINLISPKGCFPSPMVPGGDWRMKSKQGHGVPRGRTTGDGC